MLPADASAVPPSARASSIRERERRTVLIGVLVITISLLLAFVLLPFGRRWQLREVELGQTRARVGELASLSANARALDSAATHAERALASGGRRVIRARSRALAASALQSFLQDASDASRLVVTRLDVATDDAGRPGAQGGAGSEAGPDSTVNAGAAGTTFIPATLSAYCDITGLADLLAQFAHGPRVVTVDRMSVQINPALRGAPDMLQVTITLRAPVFVE